MKSKIITAYKDNHRELMIAKKTGQFEDELWNTGYETALSFVLGLMGINREQALYKYLKWNDLTLSAYFLRIFAGAIASSLEIAIAVIPERYCFISP